MNDKTEFSLEVTVDPAAGFKPLPDLVAFDLCKAYPLPGGNLLLRNPRADARAMVTPEVYAALLSCDRFRTLDEHAKRIVSGHPGMQDKQDTQANIRDVLQSMLASNIMISAKRTCDALKRPAEQAQAGKQEGRAGDFPVVVILTWERPVALERLLKSIYANCDIGKFHQLYVVDDSRKPENIHKNRELTAKFALDTKKPIQYFGQAEQQSLLDNLARQLPAHEKAIRFLADQSRWRDQWTSGLARNLALLLSCGHRLVMLDDDTLCDVFDPGLPRPDITFSDSPREADFFRNEQEWVAQRIPFNPDPVDRHMQCLGLTFSKALDVLGENNLKPTGFSNANALQVADLQPNSPVLMTECGSFGCPGTGTNTWLPDMAPASIDRMLSSGQKISNALNIRMVWVGRNQPHFSPRPNMSQITGFDNRQPLPPYFPILRGEDRLFGYFLNFIFPTAVTLDYPWAIPHLPIPQRAWQDQDRDFTPGASFPLLFNEQIPENKISCHAEGPVQRLAALASFFNDLAATPADTLLANHRDIFLRDLAGQLRHLDDLLARADSAPADWQEYLKNGIGQLSKAFDQASQGDFPLRGRPQSVDDDGLIEFWRKAWGGFAEALLAWPEIRKAAADILQAN